MRVYLPFLRKAAPVLGTAIHCPCLSDPGYLSLLLRKKYKWITPEVDGAYHYVSQYGFANMDLMVEFAQKNGLNLLYHCLLWLWGAYPEDPEKWIEDPEKWIAEVIARYKTRLDQFIVLNEGYSPLGAVNLIGIDPEEAFDLVEILHPKATRWYNGILLYPGEQDQVMRLVDQGYVKAVGFQCHLDLQSDLSVYTRMIQYLNSVKIPWAVTELDVAIPEYTPYYLDYQGMIYAQVRQMALDLKAKFVTTWEPDDGHSWLGHAFPLPHDKYYQDKPAWRALTTGVWR